MQVKVSARHGHLTEEHQGQIREKAEKLLTFFDRITMIEITVDLAAAEKWCEIRVDAEHKHDFVSHATHDDLLPAVAHAVDKMKQQIKHYKERTQDHRRDPSHGGTAGIKP
jgi:putative sigma-54 modulation protein